MAKELQILFESKAKPRILNLFFQNPEKFFETKEVAKRCNINSRVVKKELEKFKNIKLLERKRQKKQTIYSIDPRFPFLGELKAMVLSASPVSSKEIERVFQKIPRIKLLLASGAFLQEKKSPTDILIVGNNVTKSKVSAAIRKIESNTGKEIQWTLMSLEEFKYRSQINDRFLKDILGHRHKNIIDKLKVK